MTTRLAPGLVLCVWTAAMAQDRLAPEAQRINPNSFTSSRVCGECHQAIHAVWQESMHSRAFSNGVFQAAYRTAKQGVNKERASLCLTCHAPTTRRTGDFVAANPITQEGVTCDFCHSIRGVEFEDGQPRVDLNVGRTKYGPLQHAQSSVHHIVNSRLHQRSELCAVCHEYRNEHGVVILGTYSEWKASPYAREGKQCQDCHMPLIPGNVVASKFDVPVREGVNLHNVSGSHDQERVRKAVAMKILSAVRLGQKKVRIRISVANTGSGHSFPTGLPMHRALLEVNLTDRGRQIGRRVIEFQKVLMNRGRPITEEHEAFLEARSIRYDNRLKPKENRTIDVTFSNVEVSEGLVDVSFWYQYETRAVRVKDGIETIEPIEMKFLLAAEKKRLPMSRR